MKSQRTRLSEEEVLRRFPIADLRAGWYFRVEETSAGVHRVEGMDLFGRSVSLSGSDPARLLAESASVAAEFGGGYMTVAQVHAWIFLSVQEALGSLSEILGAADAINHAVPTHRELQGALRRLIADGLIRREGKRYGLTGEGRALREACGRQTIWGVLEAVAARLDEMEGEVASPAEHTEDEVRAAYEGYKERLATALEKRGRQAMNSPTTAAAWRFEPRWKEELLCRSGDGSLILELTMGTLHVFFPTEEAWRRQAPAWALERRLELLSELEQWCREERIPLTVEDAAKMWVPGR